MPAVFFSWLASSLLLVAGCGLLLGQYQFSLAGQSQPVFVAGVLDNDFPSPGKQLFAFEVHPTGNAFPNPGTPMLPIGLALFRGAHQASCSVITPWRKSLSVFAPELTA